MILRFRNRADGMCINIDTSREEQSEAQVAGKNYIDLDPDGFLSICCGLTPAGYTWYRQLTVDRDDDSAADPAPLC